MQAQSEFTLVLPTPRRAGSAALLVGAVLSLCVGCAKDKAKSGDGAAKATTAAAKVSEQQLITKINIYVACLNNMDKAVHDSRAKYLEWADPTKGPAPRGNAYGLHEVSRETTYGWNCFKQNGGLEVALTAPPKSDALDTAGAAYKQALDAVMAATKKANEYYEHGDYKDDTFAQGIAMHEPLMEAFAAFDKASDGLSGALAEQHVAEVPLAALPGGEQDEIVRLAGVGRGRVGHGRGSIPSGHEHRNDAPIRGVIVMAAVNATGRSGSQSEVATAWLRRSRCLRLPALLGAVDVTAR